MARVRPQSSPGGEYAYGLLYFVSRLGNFLLRQKRYKLFPIEEKAKFAIFYKTNVQIIVKHPNKINPNYSRIIFCYIYLV